MPAGRSTRASTSRNAAATENSVPAKSAATASKRKVMDDDSKSTSKKVKFSARGVSTETGTATVTPAVTTPLSVTDADNNNNRSARVMKSSSMSLSRSSFKLQRLTISPSHNRGSGKVFTLGTNVGNQLGYVAGKRKFPFLVSDLAGVNVKEVCAGSFHTAALTGDGKVYTFGCNDDFALGRHTAEEEDAMEPRLVDFEHKVVQVSAGDSHTAVLTDFGQVYICGSFRNDNGFFGILPGADPLKVPTFQRLYPHPDNHTKIVKIASGSNHLVLLSEDGSIYTSGDNDSGQLGREINTRSTRNREADDSNGFEFCLKSCKLNCRPATDIWAGNKLTYFKTGPKGHIWGWGMNSDGQLGMEVKDNDEDKIIKQPKRCKGFDGKEWRQIAVGDYHAICLDTDGKVYSIGQNKEGRLGLGNAVAVDKRQITQATLIPALANVRCVQVACGGHVSYAVTEDLQVYAWGFGENWQLGNGEEDDVHEPTMCKSSRNEPRISGKVTFVDAGSQHAAVIIIPNFESSQILP